MQINYGINQKQGRNLVHLNGKIEIPNITWDENNWQEEHKVIIKVLKKNILIGI